MLVGYRIAKLGKDGKPHEFCNKAFVKFDSIYIEQYRAPEFIYLTTWEVQLDINHDVVVLPTEETRKSLEERNVIVSFWADAVRERILESIRLEIQPSFVDENDLEVVVFDETNEYWNKPAPMGGVFLFPHQLDAQPESE